LADHKSFISTFMILFNKEHGDFSRLYWITNLHKNPYRENTFTGAFTFSRKQLFLMVADILTVVKEAIKSHWGKVYSRRSFNHMWILKYCKDVLDNLNSLSFFGNFVCPNMWLFYTIKIIIMWKCIQTLKNISQNAVIFKMERNVTNW
jgi:hypothetical protein